MVLMVITYDLFHKKKQVAKMHVLLCCTQIINFVEGEYREEIRSCIHNHSCTDTRIFILLPCLYLHKQESH